MTEHCKYDPSPYVDVDTERRKNEIEDKLKEIKQKKLPVLIHNTLNAAKMNQTTYIENNYKRYR
jgi:primosomal protein N'